MPLEGETHLHHQSHLLNTYREWQYANYVPELHTSNRRQVNGHKIRAFIGFKIDHDINIMS